MNIPFLGDRQQRVLYCYTIFGLLGYGAYVLIKEIIQDSAD
ncbi:hypothetical protein [Helicobacter bizzozeronii]|uniref:Uncharacterized protein n=1 Tax=Helicobacter bizzozeronii (strain CIII-1) TaxID=1002804 RepID=F8KU66_HELBC|nr:hypothetical protein [Helicobacter bizzozeronii]CCB80405.1 hypothetical protein HBZC1_14190 [Helicobacter bizzozeronii CIII-1]CCF81988.1 hypothetical protein HBZS_124390 [Helicobacter bizzozeronii CCUG 35545]